jgi:hypothetical protein
MTRTGRRAAGAALLSVLLSSCGAAATDTYVVQNDPGHVEAIPGRDEGLVTLTEDAVARLRIRTTDVVETGKGLVVPAEAVFVDTAGHWWVFTNPVPNHFVREEIQLIGQRNGQALLSAGPAPGTKVVVVGVAQLYGVEKSVGH